MSVAGGVVPTADAPDRHDQQRRASWLWLLVALQVAIPASYYLRADRDDERFAWRMFSAVRVQRCRVRAFEAGAGETPHPIELDQALHSGWVRSLERGRLRVIERFLSQRCARPSMTTAELVRDCDDAADRELGRERFWLECARPRLRRERLP